MESVKVSAVIPVYNPRERYIEESTASILAQTYPNLELILVDDASDERTKKKLQEIAHADDRVRVITHKKNSGVGNSRYDGMMQAKGEWIFFLDQDDLVEPVFLEVMLAHSLGMDMVTCDRRETADSENRIELFLKDISPKGLETCNYENGVDFFQGEFRFRRNESSALFFINARLIKTTKIKEAFEQIVAWREAYPAVFFEDARLLPVLHINVGKCCAVRERFFVRRHVNDSVSNRVKADDWSYQMAFSAADFEEYWKVYGIRDLDAFFLINDYLWVLRAEWVAKHLDQDNERSTKVMLVCKSFVEKYRHLIRKVNSNESDIILKKCAVILAIRCPRIWDSIIVPMRLRKDRREK